MLDIAQGYNMDRRWRVKIFIKKKQLKTLCLLQLQDVDVVFIYDNFKSHLKQTESQK